MLPVGPACSSSPEAEAFVRFCYQRRRVGWPELYDEMCAVATRGLYHGMGHDALAEIGVGFSLFETPRLAELVARIVTEEQAARRAARAAMLEAMEASRAAQAEAGGGHGQPGGAHGAPDSGTTTEPPRQAGSPRLAASAA